MKTNHLLIRNALFISFIILFNACGTFKEERTYSKNGLTVTYRSFSRFGGDIQNEIIRHPIDIPNELLSNHLLSLWHRKIDPPGRPRPVFLKAEAQGLSPLFAKAFQKIEPEKYLHFEYESPRGLTEGDAFASADKIHWRLSRINGKIYSNDPLRIRKPTWKLVRTKGQKFQTVKTAIDQKSQENWVIADFQLSKPRRKTRLSPSSETSSKSSQSPRLRKKLKSLKGLFDDGLINEREYQQKKEELLDQHL